jgi:hypothetical protein
MERRMLKMEHKTDPRQELLNKFNVDSVSVVGPNILMAIYIRSKKTKGGILLADSTINEDIYQGKVGLILKMGPQPYSKEEHEWFGDIKPQIGDWVVYRSSDSFPLNLFERDGHCRIMDRANIKLIVPEPDIIW